MSIRDNTGRILLVILTLSAAMVMISSATARADGVFTGGTEGPLQEAVIVYGDGMEEMTLRVARRGAEGEFGWVVPLPSEPVIEEADPGLFRYLELNYACASSEMNMPPVGGITPAAGGGLEVLRERRVGIYDTSVLRASDPQELAAWLRERSLRYDPSNIELFQHYIDKGWCFAAFRVSTSRMDGPLIDQEAPEEAFLQPLRLTFASPQAVYPLKMSSEDASGTVLRLWIIGEDTYRCELTPERATYALGPGELDEFRGSLPKLRGLDGDERGLFISAIEHAFTGEETKEDLFFEVDPAPVALPENLPFMLMGSADTTDPRRPSRLSVILALAILVLSLAAIPILFRNRTRSNAWRLFTGLCATFVTMAVVATLAMALLYQQEQDRVRSSDWEGLGIMQRAVFTRIEELPAAAGADAGGPSLMVSVGFIKPDGSLEERDTGVQYLLGHYRTGGCCEVSPDGRHLAVDQGSSLTVLDLDENGAVEGRHDTGDVVEWEGAMRPAWSPMGEKLAYQARKESSGNDVIKVYEAATGTSRELGSGLQPSQRIAWSSEGKTLASIRAPAAGDAGTASTIELYDADSGSILNTISAQGRGEGSTNDLGLLISGEYLVTYRGVGELGQDDINTRLELVLYNTQTGEALESMKIRQPFAPILIKPSGEGELFFLGMGRSEETDGMVLREYIVRASDLRILEKTERAMDWEAEYASCLEAEEDTACGVRLASLDNSRRYLLIPVSRNRTILLDLAEGDGLVISGLSAGWVDAR